MLSAEGAGSFHQSTNEAYETWPLLQRRPNASFLFKGQACDVGSILGS